MHPDLPDRLRTLRDLLERVVADDGAAAGQEVSRRAEEAAERLDRDLLPRTAGGHTHLVVGIVGPNNAGKSALFNALVGGPRNGHHYLLDANLDWGQGVPALARDLAERGNPPVWLALFAAENPASHGIRGRKLRGCEPVQGVVVISANVRMGLYHAHNYLKRPEPGFVNRYAMSGLEEDKAASRWPPSSGRPPRCGSAGCSRRTWIPARLSPGT